jgi:propanediol utilization protein/ethanolamine utilization cobalamin adenosyltransferase
LIVTEFELRANWHKKKAKVLTLPPGSVLTPSARDFLRSQNVQVKIEGNGLQDLNKKNLSTAKQSVVTSNSGRCNSVGIALQDEGMARAKAEAQAELEKPEHMTHVRGTQLVLKTDPIIAWRGQLDLFDCELVKTQVVFNAAGEEELAKQLEEVAKFAQLIMAAEVREEPMKFNSLLGWTPEQIREMSHYPDHYFGVAHRLMSYKDGAVIAGLHCLRSKVREVELYASRAFIGEDGECRRKDIILVLNRLSSLFYVLICKRRSANRQDKPEMQVPIGVSNHHVHVTQEDLEALFGRGYVLNHMKDLSQKGQFAAKETVTIEGPKGKIERVRILGPVRPETQIEINASDSFRLGVKPLVRDSGQLDGTDGIKLIGPQGTVETDRGVIVAARHIHMEPEDAKMWNLHDGQHVKVRMTSGRPVIFQDVLVRVSAKYRLEMHLDTDEANAALVTGETKAIIMEV